jgi:fermentation-respiration switch protein FrsA (DUF1100 family)
LLVFTHVACAGLSVGLLTSPIRRAFADDPKTQLGLDFEDVRLTPRGGNLSLAAWYIPAPNATRAIVFVHGKDACKSCEFSNRSLQFARAMHERGFSVFMLDLRGHGQSQDARITYGLRERDDVLGAVDWLLAKGYAPGSIGVVGVSLGAAASLYAAAEEPAICAIVSDSGYADIRSVFVSASDALGGGPASILPVGSLLAQWLTGEDIVSSSPIDAVRQISPRPIMVIHGERDRLVPVAHAERLAEAAGVEPWVIPNANHARTYISAPGQYARRVGEFFDQHLH